MKLPIDQKNLLKKLMTISAKKGNLPNSAIALENNKMIASAESWVVSSTDATAHSERMLVEIVGKLKHSNYTPGLTMVSVVEPCMMCMSACSQAGYKEIVYIIPANKYVNKISWITDTTKIDKHTFAAHFTQPIKLTHLKEYEGEFCKVFEKVYHHLLK